MSNYSTRNIIDYAFDADGTKFRDELYGSIHDRISAHIDAKKQEIARGLVGQNEEVEDLGEQISSTHLDNSIKEFGFSKTAKAIQDLHDKDHITSLEAKKHLDYLKKHPLKPEGWNKSFALEEVEELDELNDKTVASYISKRMTGVMSKEYQRGKKDQEAKSRTGGFNPFDAKGYKEKEGLKRAASRLAKEEYEDLGEYSLEDYSLEEIEDFMQTEDYAQLEAFDQEALKRYRDKAIDSARKMPGTGSNAENSKKTRRHQGIGRAVDRLTKEGYDSSGAYEKHDPKHPDFAKNYKKYKATNPQGQLGDFVAHMKKQK